MRIVCPHCDAAYEVPESRLGSARRLRCARCGQEWQLAAEPEQRAEPPAPMPMMTARRPASSPIVDALDGVPPPASTPESAPASAPGPMLTLPALTVAAPLVERGSQARTPAPVLAGWGVTVLLLAALLTAGYVWRGPIKTAWPPSQRAYAAIGLN
jgi:predicted Zn finger-like uncharacterized protein